MWGTRMLGGLAGALLLLGSGTARSAVTVKQGDYRGWAGAYWLSNGVVDLVFVPQVGRIMRYGFVGGKNVLWNKPDLLGKTTDFSQPVKEWNNYGGDKLWPSPQSVWKWPPDPQSESSPQQVRVLSNRHLLVTGRPSTQYGVRFRREIALEPTGTRVTIRNIMVNTGARNVRWGIWDVAQVDDPDQIRAPVYRGGYFKRGYYVFKDNIPAPGTITMSRGVLHFRRHPKHAAKIGADSPRGWIAADEGNLRFTVRARVHPGRSYPDGGCAEEVWSNTDPDRYMEMELMGPIHTLRPGADTTCTTRWELTRIRDKVKLDKVTR